jgi:hypothetical protein
MTLSNEPVRNGDIYCAPSCGRGCTWAEYQRAEAEARGLAAGLGPSWEPRVWENLGWHFDVHIPASIRIAIHPGGIRKERVMGDGTRQVMERSWTAFLHHTWTGRGDTPQKALEAALVECHEEYTKLTSAMDTLRHAGLV